jgi:NAD(P)H-hydrate epimerase
VVERDARIVVRDGSAATAPVARAAGGREVIVDAVFGTGLRSDVTGRAGRRHRGHERHAALRVAVDLPSGLDADTGRCAGWRCAPTSP